MRNAIGCACWAILLVSQQAFCYSDETPAPVPPAEAAARFRMPPGFSATLFAGEPDLVQPIAFTFDDQGRLWVVENHSYPGWSAEARDRILIFADRDGDGHFDERKVFWDKASNVSGIEWGFGGIWLCSTPNLVFVPDANHDDVPDGPPVTKLDGWDIKAKHNVTSSLAWGPDGWLYGCNGILSNSRVGKPGTPDEQRTAINCGVWRYHPTRGSFEAVAHGTTNPWGLDFDKYGQTFITNCVIQHLWHAVPGARFQRMFGQDFDPHSYRLMESCADHIHWAGGPWQEARGGERHDSHGGGHAHVGAMVYLGDNWPAEYHNHLFTCNLHGNRVNHDILERHASGYVAHHGADVLLAGDPWFRGMTVKYGPDGGVFVSDWSDTGECHNYEVADRTNGRIFKIVHGQPKPWQTDLGKSSDAELVKHQRHPNEWVARHARRILQERHAGQSGDGHEEVAAGLLRIFQDADAPETHQLRAIWSLYAIGAVDELRLLDWLNHPRDVVRGWAVRLAVEPNKISPTLLSALDRLAGEERSTWVRLALAAALQRLPVDERWLLAERLAKHGEDAKDTNLSLMLWYGTQPLLARDRERGLQLAVHSANPIVRQLVARNVAEPAEPAGLAELISALGQAPDAVREDFLEGMVEAIAGRRRVHLPDGWAALYPKLATSERAAVRQYALRLALVFGDPQAVSDLRTLAANPQADTPQRQQAIAALAQAKVAGLPQFLFPLLDDPMVRVAALAALAAYDQPEIPTQILRHLPSFDLTARQEALSTLAARPASAMLLLDAVEQGSVPRKDLSAFHVEQLQNLNNPQLRERLAKIWGTLRATPAEKLALIGKFKQQLGSDALAKADRSHGRAVFAKSCAACHTLFDAGGKIGPELTGSQRANLDYVLTNVLDPSAVVARDYQMNLVQTNDGRVLSGILKGEDDHSVTIQTATELIVVPKEEIEARQATPNSMMPEGLLMSLTPDEVRDLVAYLASPQQVPLPAK